MDNCCLIFSWIFWSSRRILRKNRDWCRCNSLKIQIASFPFIILKLPAAPKTWKIFLEVPTEENSLCWLYSVAGELQKIEWIDKNISGQELKTFKKH